METTRDQIETTRARCAITGYLKRTYVYYIR